MDLNPFAVIAGYVYAIGAGQLVVPRVLDDMQQSFEVRQRAEEALAKRGEPEVWHRSAFGIVEAAAVTTGVMLGFPEIIAGWVVLKAVVAWGGWKHEAGTFNRWVVGTVMAISFAAAGGALAHALPARDWWALGLVIGPLVQAGLVWSLYRGPKWWPRALHDR
jgi:hypothetical protein